MRDLVAAWPGLEIFEEQIYKEIYEEVPAPGEDQKSEDEMKTEFAFAVESNVALNFLRAYTTIRAAAGADSSPGLKRKKMTAENAGHIQEEFASRMKKCLD